MSAQAVERLLDEAFVARDDDPEPAELGERLLKGEDLESRATREPPRERVDFARGQALGVARAERRERDERLARARGRARAVRERGAAPRATVASAATSARALVAHKRVDVAEHGAHDEEDRRAERGRVEQRLVSSKRRFASSAAPSTLAGQPWPSAAAAAAGGGASSATTFVAVHRERRRAAAAAACAPSSR